MKFKKNPSSFLFKGLHGSQPIKFDRWQKIPQTPSRHVSLNVSSYNWSIFNRVLKHPQKAVGFDTIENNWISFCSILRCFEARQKADLLQHLEQTDSEKVKKQERREVTRYVDINNSILSTTIFRGLFVVLAFELLRTMERLKHVRGHYA